MCSRLGYVFLAVNNDTKEQVALKRTMKAGQYVSRELEMLCRLRGVSNTVQLIDFFYSYD